MEKLRNYLKVTYLNHSEPFILSTLSFPMAVTVNHNIRNTILQTKNQEKVTSRRPLNVFSQISGQELSIAVKMVAYQTYSKQEKGK